jgi:hypothetical protein
MTRTNLKRPSVWYVRIYYLYDFIHSVLVVVTDDDEARLHRYLFSNYTREVRPVKRKTEAVTVKLGLTIHQVVDLVRQNPVYFCYEFLK